MGVAPLRNCGTTVVTENNKNASGLPISAEDKAIKDLTEGKVDNISVAPTDEKKVRDTNVSLWGPFLKNIMNMNEAKNNIKKIELDDNVIKNTKTSDQAKGIFINQSNVNKFVNGEGDFKTYLSEYLNSPEFDMASADALSEKDKKLKSGVKFEEVKIFYDKVIEKTRKAVENNVLKNIVLKIMDNNAFKQQLNPANAPVPVGGGDDDDNSSVSSVSSDVTNVSDSSDEEVPEEEVPKEVEEVPEQSEEEVPEQSEEEVEQSEQSKVEEVEVEPEEPEKVPEVEPKEVVPEVEGGLGKTPAQKAEKKAANATSKLAKDEANAASKLAKDQAAVTKESNKQATNQKKSDDKNTKKIFDTKQKEFLSDILSIKTFTDANKGELLNVWDGKSLDNSKVNDITQLAKKIYDNINNYVKSEAPGPGPGQPAPVPGPDVAPGPVDTSAQPASVDTNAQPNQPEPSAPPAPNAQPAPNAPSAPSAPPAPSAPDLYVKPAPSAPPAPSKTGGQIMEGGGSLKKKKRFTRKKPQRIHININVGDNNNVKEESSSSSSDSNSDSDSDDDDKPKITYNKKM